MANLAALLIFSSLLGVAFAVTKPISFNIIGRVYCDNCRAGFETRAADYIEGAKVRLQCRHFANDSIAHTTDGVTDATGTYSLQMEDDHQEEICEVVLVNSPMADCSEVVKCRDRAIVVLTRDNGVNSKVRYANALGYFKDEPLPVCGQILREYDLADDQSN